MNKLQYSVLFGVTALVLGLDIIPRVANAALPASAPQFFTAHMSCSGSGGCSIPADQQILIPANKRIQIQYATATATVDGLIPQQTMVRLTVPYFTGSSTCSFYEYGLPVTWEGVISGRNQYSSSQQMSVLAVLPEYTCSIDRGIGAYVASTSSSQVTTLNVHISGYIQ